MAPLLAELPDLPDVKFPSLPPMPDTARIRKELGAASVPSLTIESIRTLADVVGPSTAATAPITLGTEATAALKTVAGQRGLIPSGRPFATALTLNKKQLEHFRESFSVVVGRVLPPELRGTGTEQLATVFAAVDHHLYGAKERKIDADRLPVLDLPEDDRVQPVVPRLVLRTRGTTLGEARQFQAQLTERLQRQSYRVGAAGSTGGVR